MNILIKNMEMPKRGETITVTICDDGLVFEEYYKGVFNAVSLPTHGDLIDRDALIEHMETEADNFEPLDMYEVGMLAGYNAAIRTIRENAPTVIPAEEERKKHETAFRHTERV